MRKFKYLTILLLLLAVYACKDDMEYEWRKESNGKSLPVAIQEARSYFEKYAAEVELSDQILGLSPGNFAPDWSKSVVTTDGASYVCVNVPIVSEIVYEGSFASRYDSIKGASEESYRTAVGQKMIVVKDPTTGHFGCYIVTIIPDEKNAVKSGDKAIGMYHNGDLNTKFSGTALFSMLGSKAYSVAAGRYKDGERYAAASWWWNTSGDTKQLEEEITELVGLKRLTARTKTMTKETDYPTQYPVDDLWGNNNSSGSSAESLLAYAWVVTSSQTNQNNSNYTNNSSNPGSTYSGYIADAGGNTTSPAGYSGTSTTTTSSSTASSRMPRDYVKTTGDKFFDGTSNTPPEIGQTQNNPVACVPYAMAYVYKLFGGKNQTPHTITEYINDHYHINLEREGGVDGWITKDNEGAGHFFVKGESNKYNSLDYPAIFADKTDVKKVVMTSIPIPRELWGDYAAVYYPGCGVTDKGIIYFDKNIVPTHAVIIIGCKANGDVIYMDPTKKKLQEVNPEYLRDDELKDGLRYIITGIRNL